MRRVLFFYMCWMLLGESAHAGILFEPSLGVPFGSWKSERAATSYNLEAKGNHLGYGYGVRLAYTWPQFYLGVDYAQWFLDWKYNDASNSNADDNWQDAKGTQKTIGPTLGMRSKTGLFWVWFTSYMIDELVLDADLEASRVAPQYKGSGYGIGFGLRPYQKFKVNFEYQTHKYTEWTSDGTAITLPGTSSGLTQHPVTQTSYIVTVSWPFVFGK